MTRVAECVNDHDPNFEWSSPLDGFRRTFVAAHRTMRMRAARQIAAAWANVCAGGIGVSLRNGPAVSLDPSTPVSLPGVSGTVGDWLASADAQLAGLASQRESSRSVKAAYRALITNGWLINHGRGIGSTCSRHEMEENSMASNTAMAGASMGVEADPEPLSAELIDESDGPLVLGMPTPNPFSSMTRLAFTISSNNTEDVSIGVYDLSGRLVRELVRGSFAPGQYEARWDGKMSDGSPAKNGLYFILGRVAGEQVQTRVSFVH
jgi:hypothetical protein